MACSLLEGGAAVAESNAVLVEIASPANNSEFAVGEEVTVLVAITDPAGQISMQELRVAGQTVVTSEASVPEGSLAFAINLPYTPTQEGTLVLRVVASGDNGVSVESAPVSIVVTGEGQASDGEEVADTEADTEESEEAEEEPTVEASPVADEEQGCENNMVFVADVTIPDNTEMAPGEAFTKTWTIQNNGTCDWGGYEFVFHSDEQMSGPSAVTLPVVEAGGFVDVSVDLVAPDTPGTHYSRWTTRASNGDVFGNVIYVKIVVVEEEEEEGVPPLIVNPVIVTLLTVDFTAGYAGKWNCGANSRVSFKIENTGDLDIQSMDITIQGPPGNNLNHFSNNAPFRPVPPEPSPQCLQAGTDSLAVGGIAWVGANATASGGTSGKAIIKMCGLDDLGGLCKEVVVNFTF